LFDNVAEKIASRPGGYTRIVKTSFRLGDNADMCLMELVDYNELYTKEAGKKTTRRSRRSTSTTSKKTEGGAENTEKTETPTE
jgi:large subunit ribosomal protein L17